MSFALDMDVIVTRRMDDVVKDFVSTNQSAVSNDMRRYGNKLKLLTEDDNNELIRATFERLANSAYSDGTFILEGVFVTDFWGFVFRETDGCCPLGINGFGWNNDHISHLVNKGRLTRGGKENSYKLNYTVTKQETLTSTAMLMSFPGALTYGHWFFDVVGRFYSTNRNLLREVEYFLFPGQWFPWMDRFINTMGISRQNIVFLNNETLFRCDRLMLPTVPSQAPGGVVSSSIMREVQNNFTSIYKNWTKSSTKSDCDLCLIRHTPMTSAPTRALLNYSELCDAMRSRGFSVIEIDPLKYTFGDTLRQIENAKLCLGQDSSALHNLICVPKDLVVIETEKRSNMLHCCVQAASETGIAYVQADLGDNGWIIDPGSVLNIVEKTLARDNSSDGRPYL